MQEEKQHISDELLARYLSGKATPEEESAVLDYMSENDERLDDLLAMSAAVEQFGQQETKHHGRIRPLWPALSIAASIALVICLTIPLWRIDTPQPSPVATEHTLHTEEAPLYATCDTINDNE